MIRGAHCESIAHEVLAESCPLLLPAMLLRHHARPTRSLTQWHIRLCRPHSSAARSTVTLCVHVRQHDRHGSRRGFASSSGVLESNKSRQQPGIAVLGGGITGLTTAYLLADTFPKRQITLIESKEALGGWVRSKKVDVGNGEILFEQGPRSLRPAPPNGTLALRIVGHARLRAPIRSTLLCTVD